MSWESRLERDTLRAWQEKHREHGRLRERGYPSHDEDREILPLRSNGIFNDQSGTALWLRGASWGSDLDWGV